MYKNRKGINLRAGIYLPGKILTNQELEGRKIILRSGKQLLASQISEKIGVERRHIADANETIADLGVKAAREIVEGEKIDAVLVSSSHPTPFNAASRISRDLGLEPETVMDFHAACSGSVLIFDYLFHNREKFENKNILVIATEKFSDTVVDLTRPDSMSLDSSLGQTIFGDGAVALVFKLGQDLVVHNAVSKSIHDGSDKKDLILMAMGENKFVEPYVLNPVAGSEKSKDFPIGYFAQNGPRVFENVQKYIPEVIRETAAGANFRTKDIDLVVVHSGSKRVVRAIADRLEPDFKVYSEYEDGNMSSVSVLYSFVKAIGRGLIKSGSRVVLSGFGAGSPDLYSSTAVIELL